MASVEELGLTEEVVQADAVELAQGGQLDDVEAPLAGLDLADKGGVGPQPTGDVLLLQAVLKQRIAQRQKAAKALIKANKPRRAIRPKAKAQPLVAPPPKVPPVPVAQIAVREKGKGKPANNTTCDIFHNGNAPPAAADVSDVPCTLYARFREGGEASEGDSTMRWTHLLFVAKDVDIRDNYPDAPDSRVYVPGDGGTGFDIVFVEVVNRGDPTEYKRVYLDRRDPTWPTNQL